MKKEQFSPGRILKINLADGSHVYGRVLLYDDIAVYDIKSTDDVPINKVVEAKILFNTRIDKKSILKSNWELIGNMQLEPALEHSKYFFDDVTDPNYCKIIDDGKWKIGRPISEAEGLPEGNTLTALEIESKINDYYNGISIEGPIPGERVKKWFESAKNYNPKIPTLEVVREANLIISLTDFLRSQKVKSPWVSDDISVESLCQSDLNTLQEITKELKIILEKRNLQQDYINWIATNNKSKLYEKSQAEKVNFLSVVSNFLEKPLSLDPILSSMVPIIRQSIHVGHKEEIDALYDDVKEMLANIPADLKRNINMELKAVGIKKI